MRKGAAVPGGCEVTPLERYLLLGREAGCPVDQMDNLVMAGVYLQERQLAASAAARLCDAPGGPTAVGYGGARGGGKSHWLLAQMGADDCMRVPGLKCLLLRKVGKANMENFEDLRRRLFTGLKHEFSAYRGVLTFGNGSRIIAGHFQAEKDIDAYLGLEYDVIGIEEATTLSSRKHQDITTCCRTSKPDWRPRIYSTTNPGGVGHAWYRTNFIAPFQERREVDTRFIPARVTDNRFCNPEYVKVLENLSGWQKRAWFDGDWDIASGQFFTTFRRDVEAGIVPTMFLHRRCARLVETLPSLQHDPSRPEDVLKVDSDEDGVGGDDAADTLRYLVATKSRKLVQRKLRGL
jgi:hypothetical protein